jgi:hypothetical protein
MSSILGLKMGQDTLLAVLLGVHFLVFSVGTYLYTTQNRTPLTQDESYSFLPVLLLFYAVEYYLVDRLQPGLAPYISLGFAAMLIGLYVSAKTYFPDGLGSQSLILSFASIVCFHSIYLELLPGDARPWLFVAIMLAFAFVPLRVCGKSSGSGFGIPILAILAVLFIEYTSMLSHLLSAHPGKGLVISFAAFASIWVVLAFAQDKISSQPTYGNGLLVAAHVLAVLGLYRLTEDTGSLAVSASWLLYAVAVIVFASARQDKIMAKSALLVLAFAAGKALLYDAASAPTAVRIFCLLLTGVVLYGCGLFMRKMTGWGEASGKKR